MPSSAWPSETAGGVGGRLDFCRGRRRPQTGPRQRRRGWYGGSLALQRSVRIPGWYTSATPMLARGKLDFRRGRRRPQTGPRQRRRGWYGGSLTSQRSVRIPGWYTSATPMLARGKLDFLQCRGRPISAGLGLTLAAARARDWLARVELDLGGCPGLDLQRSGSPWPGRQTRRVRGEPDLAGGQRSDWPLVRGGLDVTKGSRAAALCAGVRGECPAPPREFSGLRSLH